MRFRLASFVATILAIVGSHASAADAQQLQTVPEQTNYQSTARYADVVQFVDQMDLHHDFIQRVQFGTSVEGRALVAAVVATPPVSDPQQLASDSRLVVLLLGGIHAGECDGKEALLMLLRQVATLPADHPWRRDLVLLFVPQFNVDGGERIGVHHREKQVGPASGVGRRENAQQLDLNRDFMKLESPEVRALVQLLQKWQPHVFIDTHTTNGSHHRYALTYDSPHNPAAPAGPVKLLRDEIFPAVTTKLAGQGLQVFYYGNLNNEHTRWTTYGHEPRYGTEYAGLLGSISILSESYSYRPFNERIAASQAFVAACLDEIAARRDPLRSTVAEARAQVAQQGAQPTGEVPIRAALAALPDKVTIAGFVAEREQEQIEPQDYQVEFWGRAEPQKSVTRPYAYIIPPSFSRVADRLLMHGVRLEKLTQPLEVDVQLYQARSVQRGDSFQSHRLVTCEVEQRTEHRTIEAGAFVVRLDQPLGNLAVYLLEPESDDGLVTWNFFDPWFFKAGDDYPVLRIAATIPLSVEPVTTVEPRQLLDLDQIYGPERRVNFTPPFPFDVRWLKGTAKYVQSIQGQPMLVDPATGALEPWYDQAPVTRALDELAGISAEDARRLAGDTSNMSISRDALLWEHANDLYYCRLDGSNARRLTYTPEPEELATFSPDGSMVAFVRGNNLYAVDVAQAREWALTTGGDEKHLFGKLDWVYQEEVYGRGNFQGFWWSPDSQHIALLCLDETPVHQYTLADAIPYRQRLEVTHYPKAGDPNPGVRLAIVDAIGGPVRFVEHAEYSAVDHLIVRVTWDAAGHSVYYQVQNREQTWLDLRRVPAGSTDSQKLFREAGPGWIDPLGEPMWLASGEFLWLSQRTGFSHIYRISADGQQVSPVTSGEWEVRALHGTDPQNTHVYFQAALENRVAEQTYRVAIGGGEPTRVTSGEGHHTARFNDTFEYFLNSDSGIHRAPAMRVCRADGTVLHSIAPGIDDQLKYYRLSQPQLLRVPMRDGYELDAWLIKPPDFDPQKKYPVVCHVYGGPQAPVVRDRWSGNNYLWHQMLAQRGYCIWIVDNRSASLHGIKHTWPVHRRLGELELQDLEDSLEWLSKNAWVDRERVGMWGWSYGGYFTAYALTHSTRFRAGIAGAPVTDWRNYDTIYTERLMGLPQHNPQGYPAASPAAAAGNLHGKLLLIHGDADDNVHPANSLQMARALQRAGKSFSMMVYPENRHSVSEPGQVRHLQQLMADFLDEELLSP